MGNSQLAQQSHTAVEILSQPRCWSECFRFLEEERQFEKIRSIVNVKSEWLFSGCGSSYYIAQAAAASWTDLTGMRARAVPASELLLFPDLVLAGSEACQPVLISRSGYTSEVLRVADYLESKKNLRTLAISCSAAHPLETISSVMMHLPVADEKSTVMTRSFTSMLLGLQLLGADIAQSEEFSQVLRRLPRPAEAALGIMLPRIEKFVADREFADYVFLAQGALFGLAAEAALKVTEMSCSYAQAYHTLEFRHGPKSIVGEETLVTFLLSERASVAEQEVLEEIKELGATTLVVANEADEPARRCADLLLELRLDIPELARLAAYAFVGQLLGLYTSLRKQLDPDNPRHLSRVVVLNDVR